MPTQTINATEFKAKCLDILDRIGRREMERVAITKRGKVVAVLGPPDAEAAAVDALHGFMRGTVVAPEGFDLTEPVLDVDWSGSLGGAHK